MAVKWPRGVVSSGSACGIKSGGTLDLGLVFADEAVSWAGTFTNNAAAAACVDWSRSRLGTPARAIVVNSGNANACTGLQGERAVKETAEVAAAAIGCAPEEVLVASTGPIGIQLPVEKIGRALPDLFNHATQDPASFAEAIMTTDTYPKIVGAGAGSATVVGVAKGAAMCAPNMATMLAFIATDAALPGEVLQNALSGSVDSSFNQISIDGCESTNDSVYLLAGGRTQVDEDEFRSALGDVCRQLALAIARDAEGGSRLLRILVEGAPDDSVAADLGRAVAGSALWRAAVYGADPNWGRILAALGQVDRELDLGSVSVAIGSEPVFDRGEPVAVLEAAAKQMDADEVIVRCSVGSGPGSAEILSADLSPEYVKLNAEGTS